MDVSPNLSSTEFEVLYDGDCPLCMREIRVLRRRDRHGRILFTNIAAEAFDAATLGLDHATLTGKIHGRHPGGELIESVEVFRRLDRSSVTRRAVIAVGALLISGCSVANIQEPRYVTQVREGDFEVRQYGARVVAETVVPGEWNDAGNEGFRRLAGYIFGKNRRGAKIAMTAPVGQSPGKTGESVKLPMTAPVAQHREGDAWTVAFTMPDGEALGTLPVPEDSRIVLREVPPSRVAVVRFSGRWTDANMKEHEAELRRWTSDRHFTVIGEAEVNRYDPPFKPWFIRRNEVWFTLAEDDSDCTKQGAFGRSESGR